MITLTSRSFVLQPGLENTFHIFLKPKGFLTCGFRVVLSSIFFFSYSCEYKKGM